MFLRKIAATAFAVLAFSAVTASAATYDAFSHLEGNPPAPEHSVWFGSGPSGATGSKPNHFLFENSAAGKGKLEVNGTSATLTGTVRNAAGEGFDLALHLIETTDPGTYKNPFGADTSTWTFYDFDPQKTSLLTSLSANLKDYVITLRGAPLAVQFGIGANDKNAGLLGLSTWVTFTEANCTYRCEARDGDINILLAPVPLPATAVLLPVALGMMGAVGRRRRRKA